MEIFFNNEEREMLELLKDKNYHEKTEILESSMSQEKNESNRKTLRDFCLKVKNHYGDVKN